MPTADDIFRAAVHITMPEQVDAYNILGLKCLAGSCTDAEFLTACATYIQNLYATMDDVMSDQVDLAETTVTKVIFSVDKWIVDALVGTFLPSFTATETADMLPHAMAAVLTLPTAIPKKRGRIFVPGVAETHQSDSLLSSTAATALGNFGTTLRSGFTAGGATFNYHVLGKDGLATYPTSFVVNGIMGTNRRRKPGVGI